MNRASKRPVKSRAAHPVAWHFGHLQFGMRVLHSLAAFAASRTAGANIGALTIRLGFPLKGSFKGSIREGSERKLNNSIRSEAVTDTTRAPTLRQSAGVRSSASSVSAFAESSSGTQLPLPGARGV
eukprot:s10485_g1.t1